MKKQLYETPVLEEWALNLERKFLDGSVQDGGSEQVGEEGEDIFG